MGNSGLSRGILTKLSVDTREVDSAARDGEGYGKAAGFKYRKLTATDTIHLLLGLLSPLHEAVN